MKLLITTQAIDEKDSNLAFFCAWVREFAKHCESVTVICLRKGVCDVPPNVRVFALGGSGRVSRSYKLLKGAYRFRSNYDAVFVHMNPEYLVVAGWLWRLLHKPAALWYTHKSVMLWLRLGVPFAGVIFTASKESFRLPTKKLQVMGHGIDTNFFSPDASVVRGTEILSAGRLVKSKRHDLIIRALQFAYRELWIAGEGPERENLEALARELGVAQRVHFLGGRTQSQMRELYRRVGVFAHASETGSLDKVVLEALACGCPVVTTSHDLSGIPIEVSESTPEALAKVLTNPRPADVGYVRREHSLPGLIERILEKINEL